MGKKIVRLTENDIKNIIIETVNKLVEDFSMQESNLYDDMVEGLIQNGASQIYVNAEQNDYAEMEIEGVSGQIYFLKVYLDHKQAVTNGDYYTEDEYETNTTINDISITYYDENNEEHNLEYVKDENFEQELLNYIDIDYHDYNDINHDTQFPY